MFANLADSKATTDDQEQMKKELHPEGAKVRYALIGVGAVAAFHHIPGIRIDPRASLVAICDASVPLLEQREKVLIYFSTPSHTRRNGVLSRSQPTTKKLLQTQKSMLSSSQLQTVFMSKLPKLALRSAKNHPIFICEEGGSFLTKEGWKTCHV